MPNDHDAIRETCPHDASGAEVRVGSRALGGIVLGSEDLGPLERPVPLVVGNTDIVVGVRGAGDTR